MTSEKLGFETIFNTGASKVALAGVPEENYCPDCYDCVDSGCVTGTCND